MFFRAKGMNPIRTESSPGVHAIGSRSVPAMNQLNTRGQNLSYFFVEDDLSRSRSNEIGAK